MRCSEILLLKTIFTLFLLLKLSLCAYVSDINPKIYYRHFNCKKLMDQKESERAQNPDLANQITAANDIDHTKATSVFDFTVKDSYMVDVPLRDYCRGYVTLIVNIASRCGFTEKNYAQLTKLDDLYKDRLRILSFPSNTFGEMPESDGDEMLCHLKVREASPGAILAKINVNGDSAIPLYKYLKEKQSGEEGPDIKWNFEKFLIDKNGQLFKRYTPATEPMAILDDIKKLF